MRNFLKKNIYYFLFVLLFILLFLLYEFYQNHLISIDKKNLIERYFALKVLIDKNLILSSLIYLFFSALWISLIGVVTPMLIISTLMFGYFGSLLSIISFTVGSTLSFIVARRLKKLMKNFFKNIKIEKNSFFLFIIFRFIPGNPFIIKNFAGAFFNLSLIKFIYATLIAETPQILIFTFIFKKIIDSSEKILDNFDLSTLYHELKIPFLILFVFVLILFFLKVKFEKKLFKN